MLPQRNRLTKKDFDHVFAAGARRHHSLFTCVHLAGSTLHGAVVVPKKVASRAVVRNRLRRQVYDQFRRRAIETGASGAYIFIAKKAALTADVATMHAAMDTLVR